MSRRRAPLHFGQGLLMGGADVIPGVSGGTVALVVGIYERLIDAIRDTAGALVALPRDRALAARRWRAVEWSLVIPLAAGILVAIGIGTLVIPPLLERYPAQMLALFFGLVAGSLPVPLRRIARVRGRHVALATISALAAFFLVGLPPATVESPSLPYVFLAAAFAICAMILPGVSGAFLLKVLGIYEVTLGAVRALDIVYVCVFAVGAAVGLGLFSRVLSFLLHHRHDATMAVLVGLMAGALRALWPWQGEDRGLFAPPADLGTVTVAGIALAGLVAVLVLTRAGAASARYEDTSGQPV